MILDSTFLVDFERESARRKAGRATEFLEARPEEELCITFTIVGELAAGESLGRDRAKALAEQCQLKTDNCPAGAPPDYRKTLPKNTRSRKLRPHRPPPYLRLVMKTNIKTKLNQAFSLIELLVVIAVIAVIAAIAIPNITGVREAATGARDSYNTNEFIRMSNQLSALGYTGTIDVATLSSSNGISVTTTNGNQTNTIVFRLQN